MHKLTIVLTLLCALIIVPSNITAQKTSGADIPEYLLAENAKPIVYIFSMKENEVNYEFGTVYQPNLTKSMSDFSTEDDGVFNAVCGAIETKLNALGIFPQGFVPLDMTSLSEPGKMENLTDVMIDLEPYYTFTFTIMEWPKLAKQVTKNSGVCTMDMIAPPAYSIATIGEQDASKICTVMGGKNLEKGIDFLDEEIEKKGESYFLKSVSETRDIEAIFSQNQEVFDLITKEGGMNESWPSEQTLKGSKTLVVCEDPTKKDKFMKYATGALTKHFPYDYDMVTMAELNTTDLSTYDFVLLPQSKLVDKKKTVGSNGMRAKAGDTNTRVEEYTVARYYYTLKKIDDLQIYAGEDPSAITNHGMVNLPLALRRFMKVFSRE